ncbi:MAG: polysaccharide biosynthesis protein [Peptococcaceae bacterium BRH_c8a]|nr:MAG: polysaccharide biosynthesis protein [Peptococcaceae bacterium BRH_c8a]
MIKNPLNKQTVLQGVITLTVAFIIIRILGALYRIPLARMLGNEGMAFYVLPNQIYYLFFTLSTAGIPVALSSIISEKIVLGQYRDALRTFRVARAAMLLLGLTFSFLLFASAEWLIKIGLVAIPETYLGMQVIAPVIFFAAVTAAYRGLFLGFRDMQVVAYSQVVDQAMMVVATLLFSYLLLPRGLEIAAAGANLGAMPGAVGAALMLVFLYRRQRLDILAVAKQDLSGVREGTLSLLKRIFSVALPVSFAGVAMSVTAIIDQNLIVDRLQLVGYSYKQATAQYGAFIGMAMPFINISIALAASLSASLVPAVAESLAVKNLERIKTQLSQALRLALVFALPAAAGLFLLAHQLTLLVYVDEGAGVPLAALAAAVIFWSVHLVTSGTLQGMGRANIPVRNLVVGIAIKILITYYFTPTPLGIQAAALGTVAIFLVSSLLNIVYLSRLVDYEFKAVETLLRPCVATLVMSVCVLAVYRATLQQWGEDNTWPTLLAVCAGLAVYPLVLVALGGISSGDVRRLPVIGTWAAALLERLGR